jgi:hypothetical protein
VIERRSLSAVAVLLVLAACGWASDGNIDGAAAGGDPPALGADRQLAVGEVRIAHDVFTHCGLARLFAPIDGRQWVLTGDVPDELDHVPAPWRDDVEGGTGGAIDLRVERVAADELLVAPVGGEDARTYVPAPDAVACE